MHYDNDEKQKKKTLNRSFTFFSILFLSVEQNNKKIYVQTTLTFFLFSSSVYVHAACQKPFEYFSAAVFQMKIGPHCLARRK